jgi:3-deoxy-D-manno-octulosonic-acid transferase
MAAIFVRHDLWPNHIWEAKRRGVALILANASVSANARSLRHQPLVRHFNRALFEAFDSICAVSSQALQSLIPLVRQPERLVVAGDSRYDQVLFRVQSKKIEDILPGAWRNGSSLFVAGSTWPSDEEVLLPAFVSVQQSLPQLRMILVPHEPTPQHLWALEKQLGNLGLLSVRFSRLITTEKIGNSTNHSSTPSVLLVDRIGILANLYGAGQVAFVGGSFGPGVHSVLEAAVHGATILTGPRFRNSPEAVELAAKDLLAPVANAEECRQKLLELFENPERRLEKENRCREFVLARCGAAAKIIEMLATISKRAQQNFSEVPL